MNNQLNKSSSAARILLVEDDVFLQDGLTDLLKRETYHVELAGTIKLARDVLRSTRVDLLILDIGLPDGDGFNFCEELRAKGSTTPIIFLTARDEEYELVRGLDLGADDYLTKPFRAMELLSRIKALLRRAKQFDETDNISSLDKLDNSRLVYKADETEVFLTPTEFFILQKLIANKNQILTRVQLLDGIWDQGGQFIDDNTLSVHISRLRAKIGSEAIQTIRGVGYRYQEV